MSGPALLVITAALLGIQCYAWLGLRRLRDSLKGRRGHELSSIVARLVGITLLAQVITTLNAMLIAVDRDGTVDVRIGLFVVVEIIQCIAVIWAFIRIRGLERRA